MATDYWPQEEGYIVEGAPVMMCKTSGTCTEMACMKIEAGGAGYVQTAPSAAAGDSIGVALRAVTVTGEMVPVAFGGVVKMLADSTIVVQQPLFSTGSDTSKVIGLDDANNMGSNDLYFNIAGTAWILGMALQAGITTGDEILVLLAPQ